MAKKPMRRVMISAGIFRAIAKAMDEQMLVDRIMLELGGQEDLRGVYFHEPDDVTWRFLLDPKDVRIARAREIAAREDQLRRCMADVVDGKHPRLRDGAIGDMQDELARLKAERL